MTADEHDTTFLKWPNIKRLKVELVYDFIFYFMEVLRKTVKETLYTFSHLRAGKLCINFQSFSNFSQM